MSKLVRVRRSAYKIQHCRCFYCGLPIWEANPDLFAKVHGITTPLARKLQSTAEHLKARKEGGKDTKQNIVAACIYCNSHRHRTKRPKKPDAYRMHVQKRLERGRWHPAPLLKLLNA